MEPDNSGVKVFFLFFDLLLLNIAVLLVFYFSPMRDYLYEELRNIYILHANISELIAYSLYSRETIFSLIGLATDLELLQFVFWYYF